MKWNWRSQHWRTTAGTVLAFFCALGLSRCDATSTGKTAHPVEPSALSKALESAIVKLEAEGVTVNSGMKIDIELEAPCRGKSTACECYVVRLERHLPPRSLSGAEVAEIRLSADTNEVQELKVY